MASTSATAALPDDQGRRRDALLVSGLIARTVFEWYDFPSTASGEPSSPRPIPFSGVNDTYRLHFALAAFAAGFSRTAVRRVGMRGRLATPGGAEVQLS